MISRMKLDRGASLIAPIVSLRSALTGRRTTAGAIVIAVGARFSTRPSATIVR
jgi:hypothetical protein